MNNCIIPSTHAERKITIHSHKHSFTPYPSLSPYWQTDRMTDRWTNTLAARRLEELFFQLCCCVSFLFWREIGFGFTYLRTLLNKLFYKQAKRGFAAKAFFCNVFSKGGWEEGAMDHWHPKRFNAPLATDLLRRHTSSASFFLTIVSKSNVF